MTIKMLNELEIPLGVFIVLDPGTIIYSNAGEKQRSFLKDQFLEGSLNPIFVAYNIWINQKTYFFERLFGPEVVGIVQVLQAVLNAVEVVGGSLVALHHSQFDVLNNSTEVI